MGKSAENNLICKNAAAWTKLVWAPDRDQSEELDLCGYWRLRG